MKPGMRMLAMSKTMQGDGSRMMMGDAPEMRRRRDSRGRYMEGGMDTRMEGDMAYRPWPEPHIPPYSKPESRMEGGRMERQAHGPDGENPYGDEPEVYKRQHRREEPEMKGGTYSYRRADGGEGRISYFAGHRTDPMEQRKQGGQQMGFQQHDQGGKQFDKQTAMAWVESMEDAEGVKGGMYSWHQTQQYARNMGITGEDRLVEFYAAMNAMYSDFHKVGKKFGVDKPEFYATMAKCFIEDPDAVEDKVAMYYECIARK